MIYITSTTVKDTGSGDDRLGDNDESPNDEFNPRLNPAFVIRHSSFDIHAGLPSPFC